METVVGHDCSSVLFVNWGPAWQECAGLTFDVDATEKPELLFENEVVLAGDEKPTWVGGSENQTVWSVKGALRSMFADACQVEKSRDGICSGGGPQRSLLRCKYCVCSVERLLTATWLACH